MTLPDDNENVAGGNKESSMDSATGKASAQSSHKDPQAEIKLKPAVEDVAPSGELELQSGNLPIDPQEIKDPPPSKKGGSESMGKTFSVVAVLTVLSKVAGLVRDQVVAYAYGAGVLADAYNYAYMFTGNILILFGGLGGPFHSATVSVLTPRKEEPRSGVLIAQVMLLTGIILSVVSCILFFAAPLLVQLIAGDYSANDPTKHVEFVRETVNQLKVMSPLVLIAGLIGVTYGVLNVYKMVFWPSLSPAIASFSIIIALLLFKDYSTSMPLAIATVIGAVGQLLAQLPGMVKCPLQYKIEREPAPGIKDYRSMLWPALFSTSIGQLTIYVDGFFCSRIPEGNGAWTAIVNANRLVQLPLGVLITAMLVPALVRFTERAAAGRLDDLKQEFLRALRFMWFLSMPLTAALMVLPEPIVRVVFQRGRWTEEATALVVSVLIFSVPSIIFYVARDLITRVFYGLQDSKSPYHVAMVAIVLKAVLDWFFVIVLQMRVEGIALATSLLTVINLGLLSTILRKKIGKLGLSRLVKPFFSMLAASALSAATMYYTYHGLASHWSDKTTLSALLFITISGALGAVVYFAACLVLRLDELQMLVARVRKSDGNAVEK